MVAVVFVRRFHKQTSINLPNKILCKPTTDINVLPVIKDERPYGILLSFGKKTALHCGIRLCQLNWLTGYSCYLLGTPIESIQITQDRLNFTKNMLEIGEKAVPYEIATSLETALELAKRVGYQVNAHPRLSLGGHRSGFADDHKKLIDFVTSVSAHSSKLELIIDKSHNGWKKIAYEVVRDQYDNCIVVCSMENIDPLSLRTGESIVVAPSQTLSSDEYNLLRSVSIKVVRYLCIVGTCNVQFALNPLCIEYYIIKVTSGLSCSSTFVSKATGYPLGYITAKLALGMSLVTLKNSITNQTCAWFEPSLYYVTIKVPKLEIKNFIRGLDGSEISIKSTSEVISIGKSFKEAFQQALRMIHEDVTGFDPFPRTVTDDVISIKAYFIFEFISTALRQGYTIERLFELTKINRWFLHKFSSIIQFIINHSDASTIKDRSLLLEAKRLVRASREGFDIRPFVKQIDTVPAEWPVHMNYLYLTYHGDNNDVQPITIEATSIFVFGPVFYRINKMSSIDEDFRLITILDLISDLQRQSFILDNDTQRQIVQIILKLLNNTNEEVQNQAIKCLSLLVYKIKEEQIRIICQTTLCSNCTNVSTVTKQLRYISNFGLKAVIESLITNGLDSKAHILKEIMNYFINDILNEELERATDLNIIIFMLTKTIKNKNIYCEFHQKLKEIILKLLYSNKKNINALCNILSNNIPCYSKFSCDCGDLEEKNENVTQRLPDPLLFDSTTTPAT
ncbi:unnamed protein product [Rotaria sordida]|uniref:carbamoyl-phosphate synthase (ammonia) n=1 Tax=Rotaria sordida TaxID=392033 RepID=A0A819I1Z8_9BILA|nr:unnamed protein product [Rotaria sordida]